MASLELPIPYLVQHAEGWDWGHVSACSAVSEDIVIRSQFVYKFDAPIIVFRPVASWELVSDKETQCSPDLLH